MGFTGFKTTLVAAALLTAACVAETPEVGGVAIALGGNPHDLPVVEDDDLGDLPPCSELDIDLETSGCLLWTVEGSGGLYALECDGKFVCIADAADLTTMLGDPTPPAPDGLSLVADGTPIPASSYVADGTPIPAASAVADGTPIPAKD